ncbi:MAG: U32 family peptidase [Acholeplasmatales bacterium]|nr:U32 family peptidase [Acholeplasmatales bacterium]
MRLVTSIYTLGEIVILKDYIDYALVSVPHLSVYYKDINVKVAVYLLHKYKKHVVLNINRIMHPSDIEKVKELYNEYLEDKEVLFLVSDLGAYNEAIKLGIQNRIIYNPETMITNYLDLLEYSSLGALSCGVSSEITLNDLKLMNEKTHKSIFYQVFGRRLMFYSRRHLISLYEKKNNDKYPHEDALLKESTREDFLPINENEECTTIYRFYNINLIDKLNELSFLDFAYVETAFLPKDIKEVICGVYHDAICNNGDLNTLKDITLNLGLEYNDGFFYKDSVYQKEELKNV